MASRNGETPWTDFTSRDNPNGGSPQGGPPFGGCKPHTSREGGKSLPPPVGSGGCGVPSARVGGTASLVPKK
jgi:hypothetical protein